MFNDPRDRGAVGDADQAAAEVRRAPATDESVGERRSLVVRIRHWSLRGASGMSGFPPILARDGTAFRRPRKTLPSIDLGFFDIENLSNYR